MSLFLDASAVIAMIAREREYVDLGTRLAADKRRIWSALAAWETFVALTRSYQMKAETARERIAVFEAEHAVSAVPIGSAELAIARQAFEEYGKGNHPARLNVGDCFAYACAKVNGAALLYKGDDFSKTDLA